MERTRQVSIVEHLCDCCDEVHKLPLPDNHAICAGCGRDLCVDHVKGAYDIHPFNHNLDLEEPMSYCAGCFAVLRLHTEKYWDIMNGAQEKADYWKNSWAAQVQERHQQYLEACRRVQDTMEVD